MMKTIIMIVLGAIMASTAANYKRKPATDKDFYKSVYRKMLAWCSTTSAP